MGRRLGNRLRLALRKVAAQRLWERRRELVVQQVRRARAEALAQVQAAAVQEVGPGGGSQLSSQQGLQGQGQEAGDWPATSVTVVGVGIDQHQ